MTSSDPRILVRGACLPAGTAALLWLLLDGGVPLVVAGPAGVDERRDVALALLKSDPDREWVLIDADEEPLTTERLAALLRGGVRLGLTLAAHDLETVLARLLAAGLPEDGVRRLGAVVVVASTRRGPRCTSVHYLRPTERDGQGHLQRRPPAVLSAWDGTEDVHEDYAWGISPELADRVDRSQADLEERQAARARFLEGVGPNDDYAERVRAYLVTEPPRVPAPQHEPARPSPFSVGLTDPGSRPHQH